MKKELIFLGPPACGKGTQTNRLSEYLGFPHVDTGAESVQKNLRLLI